MIPSKQRVSSSIGPTLAHALLKFWPFSYRLSHGRVGMAYDNEGCVREIRMVAANDLLGNVGQNLLLRCIQLVRILAVIRVPSDLIDLGGTLGEQIKNCCVVNTLAFAGNSIFNLVRAPIVYIRPTQVHTVQRCNVIPLYL
jgi:hypothetical protein